jgi:tetratricopeptide (TPR) repeat protein
MMLCYKCRPYGRNLLPRNVIAGAILCILSLSIPQSLAALPDARNAPQKTSDADSLEAVLVEAVVAASQVKDMTEKAGILAAIAVAEAKAGLPERARKTFDESIAAARQIDDTESVDGGRGKDEMIGEIATDEADTGFFADALTAAHEIVDVYWKVATLSHIAAAQAGAGLVDKARKTFAEALAASHQIKERDMALRDLAAAQSAAGFLTEAMRSACEIKDGYQKARAIRETAVAQAKAGLVQQARKTLGESMNVARKIEDPQWRTQAINEIATAQAKVGRVRDAQKGFAEAITLAGQVKDENRRGQSSLLQYTAFTQITLGHLTDALGTARKIKDASTRAWLLRAVATAQAESGLREQAHGTLGEALGAAREIENADAKARNLCDVAVVVAKAGFVDEARQIFIEAIEASRRIEGKERVLVQSVALEKVATAQAEAGIYVDALNTARGIEEVFTKARALHEVASAQAKAGLADQARSTFAEALTAACASKDTVALQEIATAQTKASFFAEALVTAYGIEDGFNRALALQQIASAQARAGMTDQSRLTFTKALTAAREATDTASDPAYPLNAMSTREIAIAQAEAGFFTEALATARGIDDAGEKAWALCQIAAIKAKVKETKENTEKSKQQIPRGYSATLAPTK